MTRAERGDSVAHAETCASRAEAARCALRVVRRACARHTFVIAWHTAAVLDKLPPAAILQELELRYGLLEDAWLGIDRQRAVRHGAGDGCAHGCMKPAKHDDRGADEAQDEDDGKEVDEEAHCVLVDAAVDLHRAERATCGPEWQRKAWLMLSPWCMRHSKAGCEAALYRPQGSTASGGDDEGTHLHARQLKVLRVRIPRHNPIIRAKLNRFARAARSGLRLLLALVDAAGDADQNE